MYSCIAMLVWLVSLHGAHLYEKTCTFDVQVGGLLKSVLIPARV